MAAVMKKIGIAELVTIAGAAIVGAAVGVAVWSGWWIALVPGITYGLAITGAYLIYRLHRRETARLQQLTPATLEEAAEAPTRKKAA